MKLESVHEILDVLPTGVMLADESGNISYANSTALEYMGIDADGLKEININGLVHPRSRKKETMLRTRGDERLTIRLNKIPLADGCFVVVLTDITEIDQLQQELLKMDKLASVGELTSGIAHEIRNPLAGIKTTAQALNEEIPEHDHRSAYIAKIIMEIDRLNRLLLTFFDFAKPKSPAVRSCDLKRVIENTVYMVKDTAMNANVRIFELYPTHSIRVKADPGMIQQVFMNIFINAVQAMADGGRMEIHLAEKDAQVRVDVSDTGSGVPENIRSKIFDPFFTTKPRGIGLGLSISYRIVKMHSGSITFDSSSAGTKFTITLPKNGGR